MSQNKYQSSEYSYEYDNAIYKHKLDKEFILGNQSIISLSFVYALEHLTCAGERIKKVTNIKGLPAIIHQDNSGVSSLLLVVPYYEGQMMFGMRKAVPSIMNRLEDIVTETMKYKENKNISAKIMFLNYSFTKQKDGERILTPFGFMFLGKPTFVSLEKE